MAEIKGSVGSENIISEERRKRKRAETTEPPLEERRRASRHAPREDNSPDARLRDPDFIQEEGWRIYDTLLNHENDDGIIITPDFIKLPSPEIFPDYYAIIKKPICFDDIRRKLERLEYSHLAEVKDDFTQMFVNAKRYNAKGSPIFEFAKELHKALRVLWLNATGQGHEEDGQAADGPARKRQKRDRERNPQLKNWLHQKLESLLSLRDHNGREYAAIFRELPSPEHYPDYYTIIPHPQSFDLIQSRIRNRNYSNAEQFEHDVKTLFANAKHYNEDQSRVWLDAVALEQHFAEIMKEPPPDPSTKPNTTMRPSPGQATLPPEPKITLKFGQQSAPFAPSPLSQPIDTALYPPGEPNPDVAHLSPAAPDGARLAIPVEPLRPATRFNMGKEFWTQRGNADVMRSAGLGTPPVVAPPQARSASHEYLPAPVIKRSHKMVAAFAIGDPLVPFFHVRCLPEKRSHRPVYSNDLFRQHALTVPAGTTSLEIVASTSDQPLADRADDKPAEEEAEQVDADQDAASTTRSGRVSKPKRSSEEGGPRKITFRCLSRPVTLDAAALAVSPVEDGPTALAKFSIRPPARGSAVFEVYAKATGQGPEQVYRVFLTQT